MHSEQGRVLEFHRDLEGYYRATPGNLKLVVHEGTRYNFTPAMWENVKDWLKAHL